MNSFQNGAESHDRWTKMADEAKKATSQVDEAERRLRDKTKEVSALQTQLSEMTDRVQVSPLYNSIDLNVMVEGCRMTIS